MTRSLADITRPDTIPPGIRRNRAIKALAHAMIYEPDGACSNHTGNGTTLGVLLERLDFSDRPYMLLRGRGFYLSTKPKDMPESWTMLNDETAS